MLNITSLRMTRAAFGFAVFLALLTALPMIYGQPIATDAKAIDVPATENAAAGTTTATTGLMLADSSGNTNEETDSAIVPQNMAAPTQHSASPHAVKLIASFTVFLLAIFVGFEVITKVPPTLHTPLMSGSNAISGITIVGALLAAGHYTGGFGSFLGLIAVTFAMINVVGGFLVTHRMLKMFKKR